MGLSIEEIDRYSRQLILPDFGAREQNRLKRARVAVAGGGGLGCPVATYLALAGVGDITIIDSDAVDLTNLNRQFLFGADDLGKDKARVAAQRLLEINPDIEVAGVAEKITYENAFDLLKGYDAVLDGTDNFPARYAVNDACAKNKIPLFHGAVLQYEGRVTSIIPGETACFRCVFPEAPPPGLIPTCREAGVLGSLTGLVGSIQATEAIRYLAGHDPALKDTLLVINADTFDFFKAKLKKNDNCTACGGTFVPRPVDVACELQGDG